MQKQYLTIKTLSTVALLPFIWMSIGSLAHAQESLSWYSFEEAIKRADSTNKPIFVDVWAPWCGWCHKMQSEVYPKLAEELSANFVPTRINRDDNQTTHHYNQQKLSSLQLAQLLKVQEVPAIVLLSEKGDYLLHLTGYRDTKTLRPILRYIGSQAYRNLSFAEFQQNF